MLINHIFQGGTLGEDDPTYVKRSADKELYNELKAGNFCYVLTSRQMGKSSLRVQVESRLENEGVACSSIDLSMVSTEGATQDMWYADILDSLTTELDLDINLGSWLKEREGFSPLRRLKTLIESVMLVQISDNIVIFIDEIDSVLSLKFPTDDFFAFIRGCYNQRVDNPAYNRLTFCLLGVATPSDLIADKKRTPFNIGRSIELTGFKLEEAKLSLTQLLAEKVDNPESVLATVLDWTGGQPFLTQKLCRLIVENADSMNPNIEELVQKYVIENWESQDEPKHLKTIRDRLLNDENYTSQMLGIYQQVLENKEILADSSSEQMQLQLAGLVVKQHNKIRVYNPIYEAIFDLKWVEDSLADLRPYGEAIAAWLASNCQDDSRLLLGQTLDDAWTWAKGKRLSPQDYEFLDASQKLNMQRILVIKDEEKLILTEANKQADQKIKKGNKIIFSFILIAIMVSIIILNEIITSFKARKAIKIENQGSIALKKIWHQDGKKNTNALLLAMWAGQNLQDLVNDDRDLKNYPATSPILALQEILSNINDSKQFYSVNDARFSPNGKYIATAGEDGTVRIWDLAGKQLSVLKGHQGSVLSVIFSPDGQFLATEGEDATARIWNLSGRQLNKIAWEKDSIDMIGFSPDLQHLVGVTDKNTLRIWNLQGKQLAQWQYSGASWHIKFSPDGQFLVGIVDDEKLQFWDLKKKKKLVQLKVKGEGLNGVRFSPDGQRLVTVSADSQMIQVLNLNGKQLAEWKFKEKEIFYISFSPDGQRLLSLGTNDTVRIWSLSGKKLAEIKGRPGALKTVRFSPDGQHLVTAGYNGAVSILDLSGKHLSEIIKGQSQAFDNIKLNFSNIRLEELSFSPDDKHLVDIEDGKAQLWNLSAQKLAEFKNNQGNINHVSFSPDGQRIATVTEIRKSINLTIEGLGSNVEKSQKSDSLVELWNLSGQQLAKFKDDHGDILRIRFSIDGQQIATVAEDGTAKIWDTSGRQLIEIKHQGKINDVSFNLDGKRFTTAEENGIIRSWNLSGKQLAEWKIGENNINYVTFSPDGQHIVTAEQDSKVIIWNFSGQKLASFSASDDGNNYRMSFSPNGQWIATSDVKSDITKIWDLSGHQIAMFKDFISFSPDSQSVVTGNYDSIQLMRIQGLNELLNQGCDWLKDYFVSHPEDLKDFKVCQKK